MSLLKTLHAYLNLAWSLVKVNIRKLLVGRRGLEEYKQNYLADGLPIMSARDAFALADFSKCISCGLCNNHCPLTHRYSPMEFPGPSWLATTVSRSSPQYLSARDYLAKWNECGGCNACVEVCPHGVPLKEMVAYMNRSIADMESQFQRAGKTRAGE